MSWLAANLDGKTKCGYSTTNRSGEVLRKISVDYANRKGFLFAEITQERKGSNSLTFRLPEWESDDFIAMLRLAEKEMSA